jgi:processive 1,2-diacylglycerol beta-glucosyltransferase
VKVDQRRILLLTSSLGSGHVAACRAIECALLERIPQAEVQTLDFWSLMDQQVARIVRHAYLRLVEGNADLYDNVYGLDQHVWRQILQRGQPPPSAVLELAAQLLVFVDEGACHPVVEGNGTRRPVDRLLFRQTCASLGSYVRSTNVSQAMMGLALARWCWTLLGRRLEARVRAFEPDVVVATMMWTAALFSRAKERRRLATPLIGVPTDYGVHDFWVHHGVDYYCIAHETVANLHRLRSAGVRVTGIPVMPAFRHPPSMQHARDVLGLAPDRPVLLVPGGGLGLGVDETVRRLIGVAHDAQIVALTGHNAAARAALAPLVARHPGSLQVWGWTDRMAVFLRAADIVIGKLGGLTVAEALACGRPLLAIRSLRGQEGFNQRFLEHHGVGWLVPDDELVPKFESLLAEPSRLARLQHRAGMLGRRDAAASVAELVVQLTSAEAEPRAVRETG